MADALRDVSVPTWAASSPHVRKALAFLRKKGSVTADELVDWDRAHGGHLFDWSDTSAAEDWRRHQARLFLNSFRGVFDGMRVRGIMVVRKDKDLGIERTAYVSVETVAAHAGMREQVIADIRRRMAMLASELRMWKLTPAERVELFEQLEAAMNPVADRKAS